MNDINGVKLIARFQVYKVAKLGERERILCFGEDGFYTFNADTRSITNSWSYDEVHGIDASHLEMDFTINTPTHRSEKKTTYRCHYRAEVMMCLMRLQSLYRARTQDNLVSHPVHEIHTFEATKYLRVGLQSQCTIEVRADGVYQKDLEGEVMSYIACTSLVSINLINNHPEAIALNHIDNSSLFLLKNRKELARVIKQTMKFYGISINEYHQLSLEAALKGDSLDGFMGNLSVQFQVLKSSSESDDASDSRTLAITDEFVIEYSDTQVIISSRPLMRIFSLILYQNSSEAFEIVFVDGVRRIYFSDQRERILCELLASCHALGNNQVDITGIRQEEWLCMLPRKVLQLEGAKIFRKVENGDVSDRELRTIQSKLLGRMAQYGASKHVNHGDNNARVVVDEQMHSLAQEFNANVPTPGVVLQPKDPYEKVVTILAREIRHVIDQCGSHHLFVCTYLQSLHRLLYSRSAQKQFVELLESQLESIAAIFASRHALNTYWMLCILNRLLESRHSRSQARGVLLSNPVFMDELLTLFDEDSENRFLSPLATMKLCELVSHLVRTNVESQQDLSSAFYERLASKYRMLLRVLFSFPGLLTMEGCVQILSRMTKTPTVLSFGEDYDVSSTSSDQDICIRNSIGSARDFSDTNGIEISNPESLLKQYRLFLEAACGPQQKSILLYEEPVHLRLRYRCRNELLQEIIRHHLYGGFDQLRCAFALNFFQFDGFFGKNQNQKEKSGFFLTAHALVVTDAFHQQTHQYDYQHLRRIAHDKDFTDLLTLQLQTRAVRFVYCAQADLLLMRMKELAGSIGIHLLTCDSSKVLCDDARAQESSIRLAEDTVEEQDQPLTFDVAKRCDLYRLKKTRVRLAGKSLIEKDLETKALSIFRFEDLRRIGVQKHDGNTKKSSGSGGTDSLVKLDFVDGTQVVYALTNKFDFERFSCSLYDAACFVENWNVAITSEFAGKLSRQLSTRLFLRKKDERASYLPNDSFLLPAIAEVSREIEKMSGDFTQLTVKSNRLLFALQNVNLVVETSDFQSKGVHEKLQRLDFDLLFKAIVALLQHSCKPPIRTNEVAIILEFFCRVNDSCYRFVTNDLRTLIQLLTQLLKSSDEFAVLWAARTIHSLSSHGNHHDAIQKQVRSNIFNTTKFFKQLIKVLETQKSCGCLATLHLLVDILHTSRDRTDNNHFDQIVKLLTKKLHVLLNFLNSDDDVGLIEAAVTLLKTVVENCDFKARQAICDYVLESGITLRTLYKALFHPLASEREAYQQLTSIWTCHHRNSFELIKRLFPPGLVRIFITQETRQLVHTQAMQQNLKRRKQERDSVGLVGVECFSARFKRRFPVALDKALSFERVKAKEDASRVNYAGESAHDILLLSELVSLDFALPDLIWNEDTRRQLKQALKSAILQLDLHLMDQEYRFAGDTTTGSASFYFPGASVSVAGGNSVLAFVQNQGVGKWNHFQFRVEYESLQNELQVNQVYIRILLDQLRHLPNGARGSLDKALSDHLMVSMKSILQDPPSFCHDVYTKWLEELVVEDGFQESSHLLLLVLVELAKRHDSARKFVWNRRKLLLYRLMGSLCAQEIQNLLQLIALASSSASASQVSYELILVLVGLVSLLHIKDPTHISSELDYLDTVPEEGSSGEEDGTISIDLKSRIGTMTSGSESRQSLKWRVARVEELSTSGGSGPFSLAELRQYLTNEKSLLTNPSLRLCCCSTHQEQPQAHDWSGIEEFPQLRWMELTDEAIDNHACGLNALAVLESLLKDETSGEAGRMVQSSTTSMYPVGQVNEWLSEDHILAVLVQLFLVVDSNGTIQNQVARVLTLLHSDLKQLLFQKGLFFFAFCQDNLSHQVAILLQELHRVQRCNQIRMGESYLEVILPEPLIDLLDDDAKSFSLVFMNKMVGQQQVHWTVTMRRFLRDMMLEHLSGFLESFCRNNVAMYEYEPLPPVRYEELSSVVYCNGIYLSSLFDEDGVCHVDTIEEPVALMDSILTKWRQLSINQPRERILDDHNALETMGISTDQLFTLADLRASFRRVAKHNPSTLVRSAYDTLYYRLQCNNQTDHATQSHHQVTGFILKAQCAILVKYCTKMGNFQFHAFDLLVPLLADPQHDILARKILRMVLMAAPDNIDRLLNVPDVWKCLIHEFDQVEGDLTSLQEKETQHTMLMIWNTDAGLRSLVAATAEAGDVEEEMRSPSLTALEDNELSFSRVTTQEMIVAKAFVRRIDSLLIPEPFPHRMLFEMIVALSRDQALRLWMIQSTRIFWRILCFVLTWSIQLKECQQLQHELNQQELQISVTGAFEALRALTLNSKSQQEQQDTPTPAWSLLNHLLPRSFMGCLEQNQALTFCELLVSEIREVNCIWNNDVFDELLGMVDENAAFYTTTSLADERFLVDLIENAIVYTYEYLKSEPNVGGIFLSVLKELDSISSEEVFYPLTAAQFMEDLLTFLEVNCDPKVGFYSDTLPVLECLHTMVYMPSFLKQLVELLATSNKASIVTFAKYLLRFDQNSSKCSVSSNRTLSNYGLDRMTSNNKIIQSSHVGPIPGAAAPPSSSWRAGGPSGTPLTEEDRIEFLRRQDIALQILLIICSQEFDALENALAPWTTYNWTLQVLSDHVISTEQAHWALTCLSYICEASPVNARYVVDSGLYVEILGIAILSKQQVVYEEYIRAEKLREPAFAVLYALLNSRDREVAEKMLWNLRRFVPYPVVHMMQTDHTVALENFEADFRKLDLIWNSKKRNELRNIVDQIICRNRQERTLKKRDSVVLVESLGDFVAEDPEMVGGLYLDQFLINPDLNQLTHPVYNLWSMFDTWCHCIKKVSSFKKKSELPEYFTTIMSLTERVTSAVIHLVQAAASGKNHTLQVAIEEMALPEQLVQMFWFCHHHEVMSFPFRCCLKVAREMAGYRALQSPENYKLVLSRCRNWHQDVPQVLKLLRRLLEVRQANSKLQTFDLAALSYTGSAKAFVTSLLDRKTDLASDLIGDAHRVKQLLGQEKDKTTTVVMKKNDSRSSLGSSFFESFSFRWKNKTLQEWDAAAASASASTTASTMTTTTRARAASAAPTPPTTDHRGPMDATRTQTRARASTTAVLTPTSRTNGNADARITQGRATFISNEERVDRQCHELVLSSGGDGVMYDSEEEDEKLRHETHGSREVDIDAELALVEMAPRGRHRWSLSDAKAMEGIGVPPRSIGKMTSVHHSPHGGSYYSDGEEEESKQDHQFQQQQQEEFETSMSSAWTSSQYEVGGNPNVAFVADWKRLAPGRRRGMRFPMNGMLSPTKPTLRLHRTSRQSMVSKMRVQRETNSFFSRLGF